MSERVTAVINSISTMVPPAFSVEKFALMAPIIQAILLKDPAKEDQRMTSGFRGSKKRRDEIAVTKSAARIILDHRKPKAVNADFAAASWKERKGLLLQSRNAELLNSLCTENYLSPIH